MTQGSTLPVQSDEPEVPSGMISAKEDPTYKRFFKMLQVGVPEPAVRIKMQAEGLNPNILRYAIVFGLYMDKICWPYRINFNSLFTAILIN